MRRTSLATVASAGVLAFALAGCVAASPSARIDEDSTPAVEESAPPATSVEQVTGTLIEGTGYSINAPEGWAVPPDAPPVADVYVIDAEADPAGFINTVNVILGPGNGQTTAEVEETGLAYLGGVAGASEVELRPRVTIAGSESVHFSAHMNRSVTYWTEQYLLFDAGLAYTITFTLEGTISQADREALAESVLATWTWA